MKIGSWTRAIAASCVAAWLAGCGEHDHGHDHANASGAKSGGGHKHGSAHGGIAVELGSHHFQLDLFHDATAGTLTAWIMDAHMEGFVRVPLAGIDVSLWSAGWTNVLGLTAVANVTTGERVGDTAQFQGAAEWLKGVRAFSGVVPVLEIRGSRFTNVNFEYAAPMEMRAK